MGRNQRRKKRKTNQNFRSCEHEKEIILLNSWLSKQEILCNKKLVLACFDDTGRGVLTKKKIKPGEELMNLPLNLTINVTTIVTDKPFCTIFTENTKQCLVVYKKSVSFQSLLAFYLLYLKVQRETCSWCIYLESLPRKYTVPYFLPLNAKQLLDYDIISVIDKQKEIIDTSFSIFSDILKSCVSNDSIIKKFKENFNMCDYEWAYFTVNTRCVYMDLSKVIDLKNIHNTILDLVSDNTKISLCPYLDMINHSPGARNETKLLINTSLENLNIANLNKDLFSDIRFSIYTKNNFDPYTQVFICYGDSHNLKLVTEYGFLIPNNELDYVTFSLVEIETYLISVGMKLSTDQISFLSSHGLTIDLYIDFKGLSYNLYALLMVAKYYYSENKDVSRLIYSAAVCSKNEVLNNLMTPLVKEKLYKLRESVDELRQMNNSFILDNCVGLMCQYVRILENFIKC